MSELREKLAELFHAEWVSWADKIWAMSERDMRNIFMKGTIPFVELAETSQEPFLEQADKVLKLVKDDREVLRQALWEMRRTALLFHRCFDDCTVCAAVKWSGKVLGLPESRSDFSPLPIKRALDWISVEDELPSDGELVWCRDGKQVALARFCYQGNVSTEAVAPHHWAGAGGLGFIGYWSRWGIPGVPK